MNFKPHKIPNVDVNICNCEQKIAYNYLFANCDIPKEKALDIIQNRLSRNEKVKNKYDIDLIYHYVLSSFDRYMKYNNSHILTSYAEIGSVIY